MRQSYSYNLGVAYYEIAAKFGEDPAIRFPSGTTVSHSDLNSLSNRLSRVLRESGVARGDVVVIFSNKSIYAYASMLACLKLGAVYTNLDVTSPADRISKMLSTCSPQLLLFDEDVNVDLGDCTNLPQLHFADCDFQERLSSASDGNLRRSSEVVGSDPAYIMFTSGSTGFPKGAVMTHANVLNFAEWGRTTFDVTSNDVFTNVNPLYFDNSVFDFYVSLFNGACLCPVSSDLVRKGRELVKCIDQLSCTIWFSVPSMLVYLLNTRALDANNFASVRSIVFGGEGFPKPKLLELYELLGSRIQLVNVYGPTECTCICSSYLIQPSDFENLSELAPLGHIAPNFGYYVDPIDSVDPTLGELLLYGPNVGLGYFNDEERTEQSFVPDPRDSRFYRKMYRTGDLVKLADNGWLYFKGRVDNQIKHMGYRIELEEIEAALSTLENVDEVGVVYQSDASGPGHIIAYVGTSVALIDKQVLSQVKQIVPPYMVPRRVHFMQELPKNRNGKIDRNQLKELDL